MASKRNGEIDLLRFLFSLGIVFFHFNIDYKKDFFVNGYIGVEFFFLVTGYLMARHARMRGGHDLTLEQVSDENWTFIINKIKVFYKYYICVILIHFIVRSILILHRSITSVFHGLITGIPNYLLIFMGLNQDTGRLPISGIWYLSAMVIAMFILYPWILKNYKFAVKWLFPVLSLFLTGYLYHTNNSISNWTNWSGFTFNGILRALAEIALGAALFELTLLFSDWYHSLNGTSKTMAKGLLTVIKASCYLGVFVYAYGSCASYTFERDLDLYMLFICAAGIMISFANAGFCIPDCRFTRYLGRISLGVYIFHGMIRLIISDFHGKDPITNPDLAKYILFTLIICICLMHLTDGISKLFVRRKPQM